MEIGDKGYQKKIFSTLYEIDNLRKSELFLEWKQQRNISYQFSEVSLNYFELRKVLLKYLNKTKNIHESHTITINRNQRILIQKLSNFIFSCDKYYDNDNKTKNYDSEIHSFFIHLRNFIAHKSQFPLISVLSFQKTENKRFESFSKKEILEYLETEIINDKKSKKTSLRLSKEFISKLDEKPNILPLLDEYYTLIKKEFTDHYLEFFRRNKIKFEDFFNDISKIEKKNKSLNIIGLVPPLRDSEIRLIRYLINKSNL